MNCLYAHFRDLNIFLLIHYLHCSALCLYSRFRLNLLQVLNGQGAIPRSPNNFLRAYPPLRTPQMSCV